MRPSQKTESLEARIQYHFTNKALLQEALTHPSCRSKANGRTTDNQRLEFLGDGVLQFVIAETLFKLLVDRDEGVLTKLRTRLVSERALAKMARGIGLGAYVSLGRSVENTRGRDRDSTLADALEALMGAINIDGSLEAARSFILRVAATELQAVMDKPVDVNPKGELQELLQGTLGNPPAYEIVQEEGPAHERIFRVMVVWETMELGRGQGSSKKEAEIDAATAALSGAPLKKLLRKAASSKLPEKATV